MWSFKMRGISYWIVILLALASSLRAHAYCRYPDLIGPVNTPLMVAIWQGDKDAVSRLMDSTLDLKFKICSDSGKDLFTTPLINAIHGAFSRRNTGDHEGMVEFLLLHGASPNFCPQGDYTPLDAAASLGNLAMVKTLLRYGATINPKDGRYAPLISAVESGHINVVRELIAAGADLEVRDSIGGNLVSIAASQPDEEMVKFLVQLGVDPCAKDNYGNDTIYWADFGLDERPQREAITSFLKSKCGGAN
jgi:ankyrin repeat protein